MVLSPPPAPPAPQQSPPPSLNRRLGLPLLTLYGLGVTIGAGIFALLSQVAVNAGGHTPLAFLLAVGLVAFSAFSFAEFSARHPLSAGEVAFVRHGLRSRGLSFAVGLMLVLVGVISSSAILVGVVGYARHFVDAPAWAIILVLTAAIGAIAAWGILQSALIAGFMTLVEIGALLWVVGVGLHNLPDPAAVAALPAPPQDWIEWRGVIAGTALAFYAFIGFEDMVNVAEEVRDVRRTMPRAIALTLIVTTVIYLALAIVLVKGASPQAIAQAEAPMALLMAPAGETAMAVISAVGTAAILNGALVQIIMASRVIYGLAEQGMIAAWFGTVNRTTRTPLAATTIVVAAIAVLALTAPIAVLAETTTMITLTIFALVNAALWRLKGRSDAAVAYFSVPRLVPAIGFCASVAFIAVNVARRLGL